MLGVMWKTPRAGLAPPSKRAVLPVLLSVLVLVALVVGLSRCTGESGQGAATPSDAS
jgi:hypothetical protein